MKDWTPGSFWTPDEDAVLRDGVEARLSVPALSIKIGRSQGAIQARLKHLDLSLARSWNKYTAAEHETIKADFAAFVPIEVTARNLNRTYGSIRQQIHFLGLHRDGRKTRLAKRFGGDVLNLSNDPAEIRRQLAEREQQEQVRLQSEIEKKVANALIEMQTALDAGEDRKVAFQVAMLQGATLQQVGDVVGITRERVRQVVHGVFHYRKKGPRQITCVRCSEVFEATGPGPLKNCPKCRVVCAEEKRDYQKDYQRARRQSEEGKEYKKIWTRTNRLKARLTELPRDDLAQLLRQIADEVSLKSVPVSDHQS